MDEEIEVKLALSPDDARKLLGSKALKPLRQARRQSRHLVSTYFDTPRHRLRKSGIALRVRDDGERRTQTIKAPFQGPPGLQNFREWSNDIAGDRPALTHIEDPELARLLARPQAADRLRSVFTTDIERTTLRLKTQRAEVELAVDQGVIRSGCNGGAREEQVCEAEFELMSGSPDGLLDLALQVCENYDVRLLHRTKAERGYALASPSLRPRPRKAAPVQLGPYMTAGEAFLAIVSSALDHLFANQVPVTQGHPGGIHQTRVAMRRLRAALRAFKALLPYHQRKAFNSEFRWFQQRLAPARDWHVFATETLPQIARSQPGSEALTEKLRRLAREERRRATRDAIGQLQSRRYARLVLQFQKWLANLEKEIPAKSFNQRIGPFAKSVLRKTRRDLLSERRPLSRLPAEDLHDLRKRGKKARYATEFFSGIWTGDDIKPYLKLMERLQDRLGEVNDAAVARHILWTVSPARLDHDAVALVQDWARERTIERIEKARPSWKGYRKAEPFWDI